MFAVPGILLLIVFIYVKPQEFVPGMENIPFLYLFLGLALFGVILDLRTGFAKLEMPPHLPYIAIFYPWCLITYVAKGGAAGFVSSAVDITVAVILYLVLAFGVPTMKTYETVTATILWTSLFVAFVGFHQGTSPTVCAVQEGNSDLLRPDGRPCAMAAECYSGDAEPGASYQCEKEGLFGTTSIGQGRVRYRGVLRDPNEVALAIGAALPCLFGRYERVRSIPRLVALLGGLLLVSVTIVFTQSRGGVLVFMATLGAYFVKKYGMKGAIAGGVLGLPLVLLGGRSGSEADDSADERAETLAAGLRMFQSDPIMGVGFDHYHAHHHLTAHNAYLLPLAEMGFLGLVLFFALMYVSFKIAILGLTRFRGNEEAAIARTWSMALLATFVGTSVGIFFLSFTYHQLLWIFMGLSAALYAAIRRHDPSFRVNLSFREHSALVVAGAAFFFVLKAFTRYKGH
jgi:hypothetical protein